MANFAGDPGAVRDIEDAERFTTFEVLCRCGWSAHTSLWGVSLSYTPRSGLCVCVRILNIFSATLRSRTIYQRMGRNPVTSIRAQFVESFGAVSYEALPVIPDSVDRRDARRKRSFRGGTDNNVKKTNIHI